MKRIALIGLTVFMGAVLGCSSGTSTEGQPKNADPNFKPKVSRKGLSQGAKPADPIKD